MASRTPPCFPPTQGSFGTLGKKCDISGYYCSIFTHLCQRRIPEIESLPLIPLETSRDETLVANLERYGHELEQLEALAIQRWLDPFKTLVTAYRQVDDACLQAVQRQLDGEFKFSALLQDLERIIPRYMELASGLPDVGAPQAPQMVLDAWSRAFETAVENPSRRFTVNIPKRHLQKQEDDSSPLATWKTIQRSRLSLWEAYTSSGNWIRRRFKRKELGKPRFKRRVRYEAYLYAQVFFPVEQSLRTIWMEVMAELAEMLIILHDDTHKRILDLLLVDRQQQVLRKKELNQVLRHLESLKEHRVRFDEVIQRIASLEQHVSDHFQALQNSYRANIQKSWFLIGTTLYPNLLHHPPRLAWMRKRFHERTLALQARWHRYFDGEREDRLKDLELALLQTSIPLRLLEGLSTIREQITQQVLPAFAHPHKVISDTLARFRESESAPEATLRHGILSENRSLLRDLRRELLPRILESILQARLADRLLNLKSQVRYLVTQLSETHTIFRGQRLSKGQPQTRFITIEMKALVMGEVFPEIQREFDSFIEVISNHSDKLSRDVTEIDQIIEFNLGAALELLSGEGDDSSQSGAFTVVTEGLERARKQLALLIEESQNIHMLCRDTLPRISQAADRQLQELANNEKVVDLQVRITRTKLKDQFVASRKQFVGSIMSVWPKLLGAGQRLIQAAIAWYRRIRKITGLAAAPTDIDRQLNQYLSETRKQIDSLPFVYQRLFRFEPAADERFFIGREAELQKIQENFNAFKLGRSVTTALIGESGSGRTSLLNMADAKIFTRMAKHRISLNSTIHTRLELLQLLQTELKLPEAQTIDDIASELNNKATKLILVVENIQNMFLRVPGGFEAIKRFLLLINETSSNVFWVVSCGLYSWSYFERILHIRGFFQEIITLEEMDNVNIEKVIMKRHRVSGYQLEFEIPPGIEQSRQWRRAHSDVERQELLRRNFFEQLTHLAAGNLTVAILFWLKAVRKIQTDRFIISAFIEFDPTFLAQMPPRDLFTFAAFLQHETLSIEHHARVFHQSLETSLLQLSRLEKNGIIVKKAAGYQLHYLLYRPVVKTLIIHNIIH